MDMTSSRGVASRYKDIIERAIQETASSLSSETAIEELNRTSGQECGKGDMPEGNSKPCGVIGGDLSGVAVKITMVYSSLKTKGRIRR
jgi:hypothetical protein